MANTQQTIWLATSEKMEIVTVSVSQSSDYTVSFTERLTSKHKKHKNKLSQMNVLLTLLFNFSFLFSLRKGCPNLMPRNQIGTSSSRVPIKLSNLSALKCPNIHKQQNQGCTVCLFGNKQCSFKLDCQYWQVWFAKLSYNRPCTLFCGQCKVSMFIIQWLLVGF